MAIVVGTTQARKNEGLAMPRKPTIATSGVGYHREGDCHNRHPKYIFTISHGRAVLFLSIQVQRACAGGAGGGAMMYGGGNCGGTEIGIALGGATNCGGAVGLVGWVPGAIGIKAEA